MAMLSLKRWIIGLFFIVLPLSGFAQMKIGYVNYDRIWTHAEPFVQAKDRIEREFSKRDQDLKQLEQALIKQKQDYDKVADSLSENDRRAKARQIMDADRDFQRKVREFQEDFNQRQNEEIAALMERVARTIRQMAEAEKYDLIVQDAVYVNPKWDITNRVLDALKKQTR